MSARRSSRKPLVRLAAPSPAAPPLTAVALLAAVVLGALTLAGCGQMGPLVLPDAAAQGATGADDDAGERDEGGAENER